jgi:hypothetical protein
MAPTQRATVRPKSSIITRIIGFEAVVVYRAFTRPQGLANGPNVCFAALRDEPAASEQPYPLTGNLALESRLLLVPLCVDPTGRNA